MFNRKRQLIDTEQMGVYLSLHGGEVAGILAAELYNIQDTPDTTAIVPIKGFFSGQAPDAIEFRSGDSDYSTSVSPEMVMAGAVQVVSPHRVPPHPYEK